MNMTAMLDVQQAFPMAQDRQEHDRYTYENEDSGRLESAPSPELPYGMVMSDPTPTHVAHWAGTQSQGQSFTGYVQDYAIVPKNDPPPKKQRTERRRERLNYTRYQLEVLHFIYKFIRYPNNTQKQLIGKRVGISRHQAKIWFQNRRRKDVTNSAPDLADDKSMVPDAVKKGVLSELLKHKDDTPVKTTFQPERRNSVEPGALSLPPQNMDNIGQSSPRDTRIGTASPDVLASSDSNASYTSQHRSAPNPPFISEDVYSDLHSDPGSPYSPQMSAVPPRRQSTDQGVYSDTTSNPGSPYSQFSVSPTSAFKPKQKVIQNGPNVPVDTHSRQPPGITRDFHKETFFAYNDGSYYYPGATPPTTMSAPIFPYVAGRAHSYPNHDMAVHVEGRSISPSDQDKSQSPKSQTMTNGATPPGYLPGPGYQELMNYKQTPEVPNPHTQSGLEGHSDDLLSHRSHSNSETGSEHGELPDAAPHHIPMAHQAPAFNVNRVFPFPFYAEPPMALSSMPNHHYQYNPWAYQPQPIHTAPNPFYGHCQDLRLEHPQPERRRSGDDEIDSVHSPTGVIKVL